ncbi:flagellar hook-basal body protein [Geomesophilobacter sediminis]|uniref:Flagellar hook protein FlgE n=1 Tax=Geomesophilobacter sediminis TaxID=2798584 RepID=A0A8J7M0E4_9BACT|nr:flagellar hook basal-body protein [Geomesophilobacter sediminis]MBJ6724752.1 flagellar hook basal-body protein [Geomesophilobacter sediminis]
MSVTSALYTGVSGLLANGDAMNVIGNNISNVNTVGYKEARTNFSDLLSANIGNNSQIGKGVQIQSVQNIFTQGSSNTSENVTDLSIQGDSFFIVKNPSAPDPTTPAEGLLTRAGSFHVDKNLFLVNPDGYQVMGTDGKPIQFLNSNSDTTTDFGRVTKIDSQGIITYLAQDGITQCYYNGSAATGQKVTAGVPSPPITIATASALDPTALKKAGNSLWTPTGDSGVSTALFSAQSFTPNGTSEQILSNTLEASNVDMATEFVKMIVTQRAYSANSKTITTTDQMTQEVLGLIR